MPSFSKASLIHFATLHPDLQRVLEAAIKITDFSCIMGHRSEELQNAAFAMRTSQKKWPDSRHNSFPSEAMDLVPYPLDWTDRESFHYLAGVIMACAAQLEVPLTWGGHWPKFQDLPHFELKR